MTERDFCYWLHGYSEIHGAPPSAAQWQIINDHLDLVFDKATPSRSVSSMTGHANSFFPRQLGFMPSGTHPDGFLIC